MQRRKFLKTSIAAAGVGTLATALAASGAENSETAAHEFYELRIYQLRRGPMQKRFDDFYKHAAIPAMNRAGIATVGVFSVMFGPKSPSMYVLISHKSAESVFTLTDRLRADPEYRKSGAEFQDAPATDPSYVRVESSLMSAFEGMPKLEVPAATAENKARIFELRTYESHSKTANKKKIEMFNTGEIPLFRRTGLQPVFFGETLVGTNLPNLTYMITFENMAAHDKNWSAFASDPEWKKMSTRPGYTDGEIVCNITNIFLRPTGYSQI
jgi:hypothetical protein